METNKLIMKKVDGDNISFRLVEPEDAAYIHGLRFDPRYGRHLSPPAPSVEAQRAWLQGYKTREFEGVEFYYIIERQDAHPCGTIRIYNVTDTHATWGSFILDTAKPSKAAFNALVLVHRIIFHVMGKQSALFDVRKDNEKALALYRRFGASEIGSDERNIYFRLTAFEFAKQAAMLDQGLHPPVGRADTYPPSTPIPAERMSRGLRRVSDFLFRKYRKKLRKIERKLLCFIKSTLHPESQSGPLAKRVAIILKENLVAHRLLPIAGYLSGSEPIATLAPSASYVSEAPTPPEGVATRAEGTFPAIEARSFKAVGANSLSSALILSNRIHIPDYYVKHENAIITDGIFLLEQSPEGLGMVLRGNEAKIAKGIMLFASSANNWYHWLTEVLPLAFLAGGLPQRYDDFPLVIPEQIAHLQSFRDSLELFRDGREVIQIGAGGCKFNELVVIDPLLHEPMNMRPGFWPTVQDYSYHPQLLLAYRNAIHARLGIQPKGHSDRIFLARGNGRRAYNQDELRDIAARHGFRAVYVEQLSFREQVELLTAARFVIGPSGAAFANTLFCREGTQLLTWVIPQYKGFCSFANLARTVGADIRYLFPEQDHSIKSTYEAYNVEYRIDPEAFETALKHALSVARN